MAKSRFYEEIKSSLIEKEVENVYNKGLALYFGNTAITHPFACDGLIDTKEQGKLLKLIMEYKYDKDLKNAVSRASVIVQVIYYIKKFEENGLILPNICLVGDINECFVFHTNDIQKYLSYNLDWTVAPSSAHISNPELILEIAKDDVINPFIFNIDENFSFKDVADKIKDLAVNVKRLVNVTEHNIAVIYEYFCNNVIKDVKSISPNDLVAIFVNSITDKDSTFLHPKKKDVLVSNGKEIAIHSNAYNSFFSYFNKNYTPQEKSNFSKISDRLIEDTNRRNKGEFYTPTLFVDKAHRMIEKALGEDWKEKYVVWDNCCGTKNLTMDYYFKELYCSTLEQGELDQCHEYNKEAVSFQFDFLNDSLDKLPRQLLDSLEADKPIVFFLNPPYATANNMKHGTHKAGVAKTIVNEQMLKDKIGASSQNLYAQFLYRIMQIKNQFNLTNCHIALFSPTLFLTGPSWKGFRKVYLNEFAFDNAIQFKASHFADVSDNWGISFSIWHNGITGNKSDFKYKLTDNIDGEITEFSTKIVYNIDNKISASDWAKEPIKKLKKIETVNCSSAIKLRPDTADNRGTNFEDSIGYFLNAANNVDLNTQKVSLFTVAYGNGHGHGINKDNFDRCTTLFSARRLVKSDWTNWADEYIAPNTNHPKWNEFVNDSIVYCLFESKSNQSSLRNVEYKGKLWDIKNEFCWYDIDKVKQLANDNNLDFTYNDANTMPQRYVYTKLQSITLSKEAHDVLDKANDMLWKSFKYRKIFNEEHPEYQILNADIGYYQLKALYKEYMPNDLNEFKQLYKKLSDKMRPMVYELGFLKQ